MRSLAVVLALLAAPPAAAALTLRPDLPVWRPDRGELQAPAYRGDVFELRLDRQASRAARLPPRSSPHQEHLQQLGIADPHPPPAPLRGMWVGPGVPRRGAPPAGAGRARFPP